MTKKLISSGGLVVALILFFAFNILSQVSLRSARLDLTDEKLYTLTEGSRNIVTNLDEPITLRLFFSEKLANDIPVYKSYGTRVRELLEEYVALSGGKVQLEVIDPVPFSEEQDQADLYGLQGVPANAAGDLFYFGLAGTNTLDDEEVIPFLQIDKESFLEYEISRLIYALNSPKKPVVGIMSALPVMGPATPSFLQQQQDQRPWMIVDQLRQTFDVRKVEMTVDAIPDDIDLLLVIHPKNIGDAAQYAIDQYVLGGGNAVIFVDPHAEVDQPPVTDPSNPLAAMQAPRGSNLEKLFAAWGIAMDGQQVAADRAKARRVNAGSQRRPEIVGYVAWLGLDEENFAKKDVVTGDLRSLNLASAGFLTRKEGAAVEWEPLVQTTADSMALPLGRVQMFPEPKRLLEEFAAGDKQLVLAARLKGTVKTAFPDGKPESKDKAQDEAGEGTDSTGPDSSHRTTSDGPINVIVVADVDMLQDDLWVNIQNIFGQRVGFPVADNAAFLINAIDNMSGSDDLISVRSRGSVARPFERIEKLREAAEEKFRERLAEAQARLDESNQRIQELQRERDPGQQSRLLTPEQQREYEKALAERVQARKDLRELQRQFRENIEALTNSLKSLNIVLMPALVAILAIVLGIVRHYRRRSR